MLPVLSYLRNREVGESIYNSHLSRGKVNWDNQLSRLVNYSQDSLSTYHRYHDGPPFVCKFRKDNELDLLAVANENGEILIVDTERSKMLRSFDAHKNAVFDICWLPDKNFLMTAAGDFTAKLFDMTSCQCVSTYEGHTGSIKTLDVCPVDSNIFATGTRDGFIGIWDRREGHSVKKRPFSVIKDAHKRNISHRYREHLSSNSAVAFKDDIHLVSAGVADGVLKVWDLRRTYVKGREYTPYRQLEYSKTEGIGCTCLKFDSTHTKLYAYITSHKILRYDCLSYTNDDVTFTGSLCKNYYIGMDLSYDDQYILGGSADAMAYIWNVNKPGGPILSLACDKVEVGAVAWCPYSVTKLVTASDDNDLRIWRIKTTDDQDQSYEAKASVLEQCASIPISAQRRSLSASQENRASQPTTPVSKPITQYYGVVRALSPSINSGKPRSPCKVVAGNELASSAAEGAACCPPKGKENDLSSSPEASTSSKTPMKRKLPLNKISCQYHPEGCGRTKGHTRCGKKIAFYPPPSDQPSIKNFFTSP